MSVNYRKMFSSAIPGKSLQNDGTFLAPVLFAPVQPFPSGTSNISMSFTTAKSGTPTYSPQDAQDASTMMIGGIPSVLRRV